MSFLRAKADEDCTPEAVLYIANAAFDFAVYLMERKDFKSAFQLLGADLSLVYDLASRLECLVGLRQLARSHKLFAYCQEDPYTSRSFTKPRGYSGDAVILDFLYFSSVPDGTSATGREIFNKKTKGPVACSAVFRKDFARAFIDDTLSRVDAPRMLALASGHCRELEASLLASNSTFEFVAVNEDSETCDNLQQIHNNIQVYHDSAAGYLESSRGEFDLIYAFGLWDMVADHKANALAKKLESHLRPTGKLVLSKFSKSCIERGYMDLFMDLQLFCESSTDIRTIMETNLECQYFSDPNNNVGYLIVNNSKKM